MSPRSANLNRWSGVTSYLSKHVDLEASAREHGALVRRRGVRSAADLLHLALLYGPGGLSLRSVASFAVEAGIADVCDVSLLDRLRNCSEWLEYVLGQLLAGKRGQPGQNTDRPGQMRLAIVDGSTVSGPGAKGSDWRLHARYDPACGGFSDLQITPAKQAEALDRVAVLPGDLILQDRGYGRAGNLVHASDQGAKFISRIGWRALKLVDANDAPFDIIAALPQSGPELVELPVAVVHKTRKIPMRLIIKRKSEDAASHERKRRQYKARKNGQVNDPRTITASGFGIYVTSLSPDEASAKDVVRLYRMRWQIELAFKRLKSLGGFDQLRASDPRLVQTWLLAHLIAAVLIEASLSEELI
jgi:hypothetical protein